MGRKVFSESQIISFVAFIGLLMLILLPVSNKIISSSQQKQYESNVTEAIEASKVWLDDSETLQTNSYVEVEDLVKLKYLSKAKIKGCIKISYNEKTNTHAYSYVNSKCSNIITLTDKLISNITTSGDGLYKDGNTYIYKGDNPHNYILINNELYRVLSINKDGVKVIRNNSIDYKEFDSNIRNNEENKYCYNSINGCNAYVSDGINTIKDSAVYEYLENVCSKIDNSNILFNKTNWNLGLVSDVNNDIKSIINNTNTSTIGLINLNEYLNASLDNHNWLNNGENYWTLTGNSNNNYEVWVISDNGTIISQQANLSYGIRPVLNINGNIKVTGSGLLEDPYILNLK